MNTVKLDNLMRRMDRWVNENNKFGTSGSDPMVNTEYYRERTLKRGELEALFVQDWLSRRVVSIPANDSTRAWIKFSSENSPEKAEAMEEEFKRLNIKTNVSESIKLARLHGGSLMIMGVFDGQESDMPIRKIKSIEFAAPVDRWQIFPQRYYTDDQKINFGQVETYLIHRLAVRGTLTAIVHESRVIRFDGAYTPPLERLRNLGWSNSVLQNAISAIQSFGVVHQSADAVVQDFVTKKAQIKNLRELLSNDEGEAQITARLATLAYGMSVHGLAVYGEDEEFDKMGTPITGLPDLLRHSVDIVSAAVEIPKARLFHNQSGLLGGDAGSSDLRVHYDNISAFQETDLRPQIQKVVDLISESLGYQKGDVSFEFNPLWQLSELDESKVRKEISETDINYINAGVLEPEEVALSRFSGDSVNLSEMIIDVDKRKRFLEALAKQPIDLDEGNDEDEVNMNNEETSET